MFEGGGPAEHNFLQGANQGLWKLGRFRGDVEILGISILSAGSNI